MKRLHKSGTPESTGDNPRKNILNHTNFLLIDGAEQAPVKQIGWRGALAAGLGQFRINGTYDYLGSGRVVRRKLKRMAKRGAK